MKVSGAGVKEEQGLLGAEAQKVRLQMLITHFFREIMAGAPADSADKIEPNDAAAMAVKKASEWVGTHGAQGPLPEGCK